MFFFINNFIRVGRATNKSAQYQLCCAHGQAESETISVIFKQ